MFGSEKPLFSSKQRITVKQLPSPNHHFITSFQVTMMKAICIDKFVDVSCNHPVSLRGVHMFGTKHVQSYDEIRFSDVPVPQPKECEVFVKIFATGVNYVDLLYVS